MYQKYIKIFPKFNISKSNTNEPLFFNPWKVFPKILYHDTFVHYSFCLSGPLAVYFTTIKGNSPFNFTGIFKCGCFDELISYFVGISKKEVLFKVLMMAILVKTILLIINLAI